MAFDRGLGCILLGILFHQCMEPYLGYDLVQPITNLTGLLPTLSIEHVRSRIYRNRTPDGLSDAIYFPLPTGAGIVTGITSTSTAAWSGNAFLAPMLPFSDPNMTTQLYHYFPYFLNVGISSDSFLSNANRTTCCTFLATHGTGVVDGLDQLTNGTWTDLANPFSNQQVLTFNCDLVVKPGVNLKHQQPHVEICSGCQDHC